MILECWGWNEESRVCGAKKRRFDGRIEELPSHFFNLIEKLKCFFTGNAVVGAKTVFAIQPHQIQCDNATDRHEAEIGSRNVLYLQGERLRIWSAIEQREDLIDRDRHLKTPDW